MEAGGFVIAAADPVDAIEPVAGLGEDDVALNLSDDDIPESIADSNCCGTCSNVATNGAICSPADLILISADSEPATCSGGPMARASTEEPAGADTAAGDAAEGVPV